LAGGAYAAHKYRKKGMTPERKAIFEAALRNPPDPEKLRKLANEFEKEGLKKEADLLRKRANLRELPKDQKIARSNAFRAALNSTDIAKVEKMAQVFHAQGATGSAGQLYKHAASLRKLQQS